ncbi:hypothetical protein SY88_00905 [Clostridiales bacterium PH28_bin88]|nr:hypothetical protein SY88_00905 [Clostridiales bacterium PH28_bin88]
MSFLLNYRVKDVMSRELVVAYPEESLSEVVKRFAFRGIGRLPVVSRQDPCHLEGLLTRTDILKTYNRKALELGSPRQLPDLR